LILLATSSAALVFTGLSYAPNWTLTVPIVRSDLSRTTRGKNSILKEITNTHGLLSQGYFLLMYLRFMA